MSKFTALRDANVLYPAPMRDLFMQLAVMDVFAAKWTAEIHREWIEALLRNEPHRERAALERTRELMDRATRDCLVTGYESLLPAFSLPDPHDRHVIAAAVAGHCDVIVTQNLKHFPSAALDPFGIEAQHPDKFLCDQFNVAPELFCAAVRRVRARLNNPTYSPSEYLDTLTRQGLIVTAAQLKRFAELL